MYDFLHLQFEYFPRRLALGNYILIMLVYHISGGNTCLPSIICGSILVVYNS